MGRQRLLITGATGFIGRYIVDLALHSTQWEIFVAVRKESRKKIFEREVEINPIEVDFYNEQQMTEAFDAIKVPDGEPPFTT